MITHLPADIELSFAYRGLSRQLGQASAAFVFTRLWSDLAFQTRVHGKSGIYQKQYIHHFEKSTESIGDAIQAAIDSGLVQKLENGDLFCPVFFEYNAHLDASYIPPTVTWLDQWTRLEEGLKERSPKLIKQIPRSFWYLQDGAVIMESCMNRALIVIHTLDFILHRKHRTPDQLEIGVVQSACGVVTRHSDAKISVFLKRFMSLSRPRLNPLYPPTTEEVLQRFEDMLVLTSPDEGFEAWAKKLSIKNEEETRPQAIGREITERLAGIPA